MVRHKLALVLVMIAGTGALSSGVAVAATSHPGAAVHALNGPLPGHCGTDKNPCPK